MKIGDYITRLTGLDQFSLMFGRGGQGALFSVDVLDVPAGSGKVLTVTVQHKNVEDTSWTSLVVFSSINSTGIKTATGSAIKEQLRFVYSVSGGASPEVYDTYYINVLAPVWTP